MADIYKSPVNYINTGTSPQQGGVQNEVEDYLNSLPPEERDAAMKRLTAPPSNKEIAEEALSSGRMPTIDEFRAIREYNKEKEVPILESIGNGFIGVMNDLGNAVGSAWDDPVRTLKTAPANVIEGFAQGTRNLYGMLSQSSDPSSKLFRLKSVINHADSDEEQYRQYMDAWKFNKHTEDLISGKETVVMDKDVIDPHIAQAMSYVLDPTLFIPFGEVASAGVKAVGMGEKLVAISARSAAIKNMVLGGTLKWGVGAPLEFMGGAIRNTIDYGIEQGAKGFEVVSGIPAKEIQTTARLSGWGTAAGSVAGFEVNNALGTISRTYAGAAIARNAGEAISIIGDQMIKQRATGRGVLGYAGQAIRDSERAGIQLSAHTKALLRTIEAVDPLFVYTNDIVTGAAHGAAIGGTLGYLSGGEEGMYHGMGAGIGLGAVGAGAGKVFADITGNTKLAQMAIQRKLVIEALKELGNDNAKGFEAMAKMAEATGDRAFQGYIDGIIAGIDTVNPDAVFKAYGEVEYNMHLRSQGIDPATGVLLEKSRIFPELVDRKVKADVLGILRDAGNRFAGDAEGFKEAIANKPEFSKLKDIWNRLDDNAKDVILKQIKLNGDADFIKSLRGRQLNAHWSDLAYSEKAAEIINELHQKNANSVPDKIRDMLKQETRRDKKLTRRGQMLKEKLQADGYIDREGNIRSKRLVDVEGTQAEFEASAGWAKRRDANGKTEVVINLDKWARDSGDRLSLAHELYHSIMMDSVFKPDYIDRLTQKLVGKFDPQTGRILEPALVKPDELMKFFSKYIENDPNNKRDPEAIKRKKEELQKSIEEFRNRGVANRVVDSTATPLEHLVEEFGAYYFSKWLRDQPVDFLFRGGEFSGVRGLLEMAKDGWLDYWKGKVAEKNPNFNFDAMDKGVSRAFDRDGNRVLSRSLDLFMRDIVRIEANRNNGNRFDISRLSNESREWFIKVNGLRGAEFGQIDKQGNLKKPKLRRYTSEEIRQGKEMFKVLESLPDAAHKDGMRRDGDGNWSGKPNTAQINALVGAGYIQRAWFDRMMNAYAIVEGNGSNVVEFGYLGYSAHIGDGDARVYGAAVPFKNRRAVLIGVDFKVKADGTVFSNFHTLDLKVIEARGNEIWKDPQTRELWNGNRTEMEADFYAYLSNASLPSNHPNRKPSARILDKGDGLGSQRRDALHQMLGFHKYSDLPYINRPIAEIPVGIRHSVTTFSNDGIVNLRVDNKQRYNFNFENAHLDLSRNFMPSEMKQETTPSGGKIIKHATGYQISKQAGTKFKVFDPEGKHLGDFDTIADAGRAAQKHFNEAHEAKTEGKDPAVPRTEVPPSRVEYKDKRVQKILDDNKIEQAVIEALEKEISGITSKENYPESAANYYAKPFRDAIKAIKKDGLIKAVSNEDANHAKILQLQQIKPDVSSLGDIDIGIPHYAKELKVSYLLDKLTKLAQHEYDAMYPMEIKSALHGQLAQIFQDYPNITAQGLLKKLVTYGSRGNRFFQEATEIGLVDLLKSKIQRTTSPMRMEDGRVIQMPRGGETQPRLDMSEILDFAKSKEIRVTIEEGAREVNNMDTSRFTLGGAKSNYKQTAVRINPEYAHGIRGHYGENTIVHFRTTERINADGTRHLFIEEVQANNTDKRKITGRLTQDREFIVRKNIRTQSEVYNKARADGIYVENRNGEGFETEKNAYIKGGLFLSEKLSSEIGDLVHEINPSQGYDAAMSRQDMRRVIVEGMEYVFDSIGTETNYGDFLNRLELETESVFDNHFKVWKKLRLSDELHKQFRTIQKFEVKKRKFFESDAVSKLIDEGKITNYMLDNPDLMRESISDNESLIQLHELSLSQKESTPLPLTAAKDWTLTALKGIIRQAIRDGLDKITLTHPDDSPPTSNMKPEPRRALYGKLIPEVWGSWLRKYGIELKQEGRLATDSIEKARADFTATQDKVAVANKAVLDKFNEVGSTENPQIINSLSVLLATPVHEWKSGRDVQRIKLDGMKLNDESFSKLVQEAGLMKEAEYDSYVRLNKLREDGIRATSEKSTTDEGISAEAIDRGMTFELNDRIKREFLEGRINTHSMPSEDIYSGGRVYDQNSKQFKSGFVGLYAAENPDRVKGVSLQFMKRADGSHRIRLTDNSKKGESADIGHITANIEGDRATLSSHINEAYRGKKLAYVVYSEMAERLRAMGVTAVDGQIVNPDGIPIKVRERIIGDTRDLYSGRRINHVEGANRIRDKQEMVGSMGGVDVTNTLYKQGRYMPAEYQGGDDYYKPRGNPFESKDEQGMLVRKSGVKKEDGTFESNPQNVDWFDIGHFNQGRESAELNKWERINSGLWLLDEKTGIETINPVLEFDNPDFTHNQWIPQKYPSNPKKSTPLGRYENPRYGKNGELIERGKISINSPSKKPIESMAQARKIKSDLAKKLGFKEDDFDAYLFNANPEVKQSMGFGVKDQLHIKFQPAEGEQGEPIRLSGKMKTVRTKKVSTNQYETGEGNRTYDTNSRQWTNGFIGRYAEENPILTKGVKLSMKNWDRRTDDYGRRSIELKEGNNLIGRIDYEVKKGSGGKWLLSDPTVRVWEKYRGKGYSNLLYSEMAERARFLGAEDFLQRIENDQALPMFAQVKTFGFGESKLIDADRGQYFPPTKENFNKLKKPLVEIHKQDGSVETMEGYEPWVHSWSKIFSDRHYQPSESWEKSRELGMKSTWNSLPESSRKLFELNIKKFGLTNSPYEAGYILPDARMLDFSGRYQSSGFKRVKDKYVPTTKFDDFKDSRALDHREAVMLPEEEKKMKEEYGWEEDKIGKMQQAGAIRIDHSNYGKDDGRTYLDIGSIPTNKQYEAILDIIKNSVINKEKHTLGVDIRVNGRAINHPLHDMSVENPERVILALKREVNKAFKQEGNRPNFQPSEYTEFKSEHSATGRILRNAKGYVIMMSGQKFRVYNPAKAIIGVYGSEEEAKKRIYREIPKQ